MRTYLTFLIFFIGSSFYVQAQLCCNVVDGSGVAVTTTNGLCVVAPNLPSASSCSEEPVVVDSDGDGVIDREDDCPSEPGSVSNSGCPEPEDTDGDGVLDDEDECPSEAGLASNSGCPIKDADGDGIADADDNCPDEAGVASNSGCPEVLDSDGDGVADPDDHCPNEVGIASNAGCPELKEEEKEVLKAALEGVNFLSSKDVLTEDSKPKLHNVAELLKAHPGFKLKVSGYTDNTGKEEMNLELSKKRANAVKSYLISDGIDASRVQVNGYGEANPIADNNTREGRAKNRRVEFEIIY